MNTTKLIQAIKLIIESEVKKQLALERKQLKESILKELKRETHITKTSFVEKDPLDVEHLFETKQKPKQNKLFGGNSALSSVLNETYQSGEWRDINGGHSFTSDMAQGFSSMNNTMNTANSVVQDVDGNAISMDRLSQTPHGEAVVNALTKDYSQLMQAINNKKRG
jgi:hypothetical protein